MLLSISLCQQVTVCSDASWLTLASRLFKLCVQLLLTMLPRAPLPKSGSGSSEMGINVDAFIDRVSDSDALRRYKTWAATLAARTPPVVSPAELGAVISALRLRLKTRFHTRRAVESVLRSVRVKGGSHRSGSSRVSVTPSVCTADALLSRKDLTRAFGALQISITGTELNTLMAAYDPTGSGFIVCGALFDTLCVVFPHAPVSSALMPSTLTVSTKLTGSRKHIASSTF